MRRAAVLTLLLSSLFFCNGCFLILGAGAGIGGYSYVKGELSRAYAAGLDPTWSAVQQTLSELALRITDKQKDGLGGTVEAQRADGTRISLRVEPGERGATTVRVRVGVFGDRKASEDILSRIARNLRP